MELRDIEIFLTLAEELHFGRTAERLHVTPARVSQAIKKQERTIGAELFERTSRIVRLTPIGEQLRDELEVGYRQIRQAIGGAAAAVRGISGTVRVGFSGPWCGDLIVKAAEVFRDRYPACGVQIVERMLADRFGPLRAGEIDLQLTELPADEPDIVNGPILFRERRALQVPLGHPLAGRQSVTLEDYGDCEVIVLANVPDYFLDYHVPRRTPSGRPIRRGPAANLLPGSAVPHRRRPRSPALVPARGGISQPTRHRHRALPMTLRRSNTASPGSPMATPRRSRRSSAPFSTSQDTTDSTRCNPGGRLASSGGSSSPDDVMFEPSQCPAGVAPQWAGPERTCRRTSSTFCDGGPDRRRSPKFVGDFGTERACCQGRPGPPATASTAYANLATPVDSPDQRGQLALWSVPTPEQS